MAGSAVIGALRVNLSADTAEFKRALSEAERIAGRFSSAVATGFKAGALSLAAAAAAGVAGLAALTKASFDTISAQVDLAHRVGASVAAIQTLEHATQLSGGSTEALAKALGTLNAKLGEAATKGAGPAYEAIQRLGLSIQDLSNADADERIKMISDAMAELGFTTQQQASTLRDLGIKQQEIINLFQEGSSAINQSRDDLKAWGVLLSDVDAAKVESAGDAFDKIKTVLEGVGNQIAIRLAPLLQALADYLTNAAKETGGFGGAIDKAVTLGIHLFAGINREIYDFRISVDEITAGVLNLWDAVAGAPPNILAKVFGGTAEDYGFKPINESFGHLKDTLEKPPTDAEWDKWFEDLKKKSDDAAAASVQSFKRVAAPSGEGNSEADQKLQKKLLDQQNQYQETLQQRLASLQEELQTETEAELAQYDERMKNLEDFHAAGLLSDTEYRDLLIKNQQDHAQKMKDIDDDITQQQLRNAQKTIGGWADVADNIGQALDGIFGESKAVAIAQAIINTAQAVTRSLAEYGATPLGLAAAAAAAAAGAVQIATITRTTKNSKGHSGGSGASVVSAPSAGSGGGGGANAGANQTLFISGLTTGSLYSGEAVRELAEKLIEYQRDGGKVVLAQT